MYYLQVAKRITSCTIKTKYVLARALQEHAKLSMRLITKHTLHEMLLHLRIAIVAECDMQVMQSQKTSDVTMLQYFRTNIQTLKCTIIFPNSHVCTKEN